MKKISSIHIILILGIGLLSCSSEQTESTATRKLSPQDIQQLAEDAYLYGLQQTIFYEARFN